MLPGARPLQVPDAGMRRLPGSLAQSLGLFLSLLIRTLFAATVRPSQPPGHRLPRRCCPFKGGRGLVRRPGFPWGAPDHLSPAAPRPFPEGWEKRAGRTVEALPCAAVARRMRTAGQVRGALTSWHSPSPLRRYPVHPGLLPSPLQAAVAAVAWLFAAPPEGQVRRGSRSGRRRPAPGPGLPLAP